MAVVIANARQSVDAPVRRSRRFGVFSVVTPVDGADSHWLLGGLLADGEECSKPLSGTILCGPTAPKTARSWFSDAQGDPWLTYMFETCKAVGRFSEASGKLRTRFLASEQSAVEAGLEASVLAGSTSVGTATSMAGAIGALEADAGANFGGEIIIWLPFALGEQAVRENLLVRSGDQLETVSGSPVVIGNFPTAGGATKAAYGSGVIDLYRSGLVESGPFLGANLQNDYYTLIERAYGALADCWRAKVTATIAAADVSEVP